MSSLLDELLCNDPSKVCQEYQKKYQLAPELQHVLNFTDLRGIERGVVCETIRNQLQDFLVGNINQLDIQARLKLLEASIPFLSHPKLGSIPQLLLETHPVDLPMIFYQEYLPSLPQTVQDILPSKVRRRCWELFPKEQFVPVVDSLIDSYIADRTVKLANESFDLQLKRRRDKIPSLEMIKTVLGDSKMLLRQFQMQIFNRMLSLPEAEAGVFCGLYFDVIMVTGPADRSSKQDVPYLLEVIRGIESIQPLPVHPQTITEAQRTHLLRVNATIQSLFREFRAAVAPKSLVNSSVFSQVVPSLVERLKRPRERRLFDVFFLPVVVSLPAIKDSYLAVISKPMDVQTMLSKEYTSFEEIDKDLQLIYSNCCTFNPTIPDLCAMAENVLILGRECIKEFRVKVENGQENGSTENEVTQTCIDCFVSIADPLISRKLAKLCLELLYFDSFNRGLLPRDVQSLRILANLLSLSKNRALTCSLVRAFQVHGNSTWPVALDEVSTLVTQSLVSFQTLFLFREQDPDCDTETRVLSSGSFFDPTCKASCELLWRFLLDVVGENELETTSFPALYTLLRASNPPVGFLKQFVKKKHFSREVLMGEYLVYAVEEIKDVRVLECAASVFSQVSGDTNVELWVEFFRRVMPRVDSEVFQSKAFKRARLGLEEFLAKEPFTFLRKEFALPEPVPGEKF